VVGPHAKRRAVDFLKEKYSFTERRACRLVLLWRSTQRYKKKLEEQKELRERMRSIAERWRRFGYRRIHVILKREGVKVNHKRVYRLYKEEQLSLRAKKRKKSRSIVRAPIQAPTGPNERWSMDFVSDQLSSSGRRIRCLNIVDDFSRECVAIEVDTSLPGYRVVQVLEKLKVCRGLPKVIVIDNGSEFTGKDMDQWAHENNVKLDFIRPGKPIENAFAESFNGRFRDECLNQEWFTSLQDAKDIIERWRQEYNQLRPHSSLGDLTPEEFVKKKTA
jgi:putative transposase